MSVARFVADQRTKYRVPHTFTCALLGISVSWFYKWIARAGNPDGLHTDADRRRSCLDEAVAAAFGVAKGLHGSPRLVADLRDLGWTVSEKTVADSMRRQGLVARRIRRRGGCTRQDKSAPKFPDLLKRNFAAEAPNQKWVGDMTEIPTASGKLYLATVIDLYSRRLLGAATSRHPDAELACAAIRMAVAARGGPQVIWRDEVCERVIFHTDRGSTYTAKEFRTVCTTLGIRQSMGRVGSCFDNAAAEAFFSSLEWEVLSRNTFDDTIQARAVVIDWCYTFYNHQRRHSAADGLSPINYEIRESKHEPQAA
ncbi:IS3 family transposase [Mycolicibacterium gilvum]|uniref:Transposase n=1 Tax=Mycolicibacterium gilvum (strain DSM 45189 / LMG 24558 / Spyr1) TaxID=278137 RepID=E6TJ72_MYCSR|nr:IS3 family transposase [Mycolicibacterium gilvum]ADT99149.1 transposase [Mycolicibacterium gilvum Spyr1]